MNFLFKSIFVFFCCSILRYQELPAQNISYARSIIENLASPEMHGRGYVLRGDSIAADYIKSEMTQIGLKSFNDTYLQPFNINVNTLPGALELKINSNTLMPGRDYIVLTPSSGQRGCFKTRSISHQTKQRRLKRLQRKGLEGKVLIVDNTGETKTNAKLFDELRFYNTFNAEAVISLTDKKTPMMWSVYSGHLLIDFPSVELNVEKKIKIRRVEINIENEYRENYPTQNVAAYVEGTKYPDSFFVFVGHYDHLGRMGRDTYYPGAHDNASGIAMMLDLAKYYSENPNDYSVAFIAMAGEEAGLRGSRFYSEHPLFPLENIKFLINLDMVSTGEEGMMVVNGDVFENEFQALQTINNNSGFLSEIKSRGEAANSDHYFFYTKGVKCFYFYTLGGTTFYHNINDKPEVLSLFAYNKLFNLITHFVDHLSKN
ncbi:MAG: M28 family peptidase [Bacteroidales bacterium]|nr:M28 family peptidase [Bacteroidales bacterium]